MSSPRPRPTATLLALTIALVVFAAAGCGSSTKTISQTGANGEVTTKTVPNVHFAKTKFVLHMGLAFGAFHRYIYKPLQFGTFRAGRPGRIKALVKAAAATVFIAHELKLANEDALSDERLRPLAEKVDALASRIGNLAAGLRSGSFSPTDILGAGVAVATLTSLSRVLGARVKTLSPAL